MPNAIDVCITRIETAISAVHGLRTINSRTSGCALMIARARPGCGCSDSDWEKATCIAPKYCLVAASSIAFSQSKTGRIDDRGVLMLRLCGQIDRQYEARAISVFSLSIDIGPHNRISLVIGVSPVAECPNRLRATRQRHPG